MEADAGHQGNENPGTAVGDLKRKVRMIVHGGTDEIEDRLKAINKKLAFVTDKLKIAEEAGKEEDERHAQLVLVKYNRSHTLNHFRAYTGWVSWTHINFLAEDSSNASPLLFFAELSRYNDEDDHTVTYCTTLSSSDNRTTNGCGFCDADSRIRHPPNGYREGHYKYAPRLRYGDHIQR